MVSEAHAKEKAVGLSCPSADTGTSRARAEIGECRALLEARKNLEKCLEGSSSGRVTDHKKLSPDTSKDLGVQGWEVNHPHPHPTIHTPPAS